MIISQLAPKDAEARFDYKQHSFDIMIYLKMLFEPKNLKRKDKYYSETMTPTALVDKYSQDYIRDSLLKVLLS